MREIYTNIELDISNVCNLKCPLCNREDTTIYNKTPKYMQVEDIAQIIKKFPNIKQFNIGFLICEPTINKNLLDILNYLKNAGKNINLSTNGQTQTDFDFWFNVLNILDEKDKITWSLDGFTDKIYSVYRIGGNLSKIKKSLIVSADAKTKIKKLFDKNTATFIIQIIKFAHNKKQIETKFESFKNRYNELFGKPVWNIIESNGKCTINIDSIEPTWDINKWKELKRKISNQEDSVISTDINCICRNEKIVFVDYLGRIGFCLPQLTDSIKFGDPITIYDTIDDIDEYIEKIYNERFTNKICQFNCGNKIRKLKEKNYLNNDFT